MITSVVVSKGGEVLLSAGIAAMSSEDKANIVSLVQNLMILMKEMPLMVNMILEVSTIKMKKSYGK